mmetsp:Transcript_15891/g.34258  ORF Transcript_15891/g.34258 Transcript_15891/m.34258 type:complete len:157 (+) Transcript_15891:512-982(+)
MVLAPPCPSELVLVAAKDHVPSVPIDAASLMAERVLPGCDDVLSWEVAGPCHVGRRRAATAFCAAMSAGSFCTGTMICTVMKLSDSTARVDAMVRTYSHKGVHALNQPNFHACAYRTLWMVRGGELVGLSKEWRSEGDWEVYCDGECYFWWCLLGG